jgi:hypothetical protein
MLTTAQRQARASRIGASEVAALLERHPFITPADVYRRIVEGDAPEPNAAMIDGKLAEPHVLAMARAKWRIRARACGRGYTHPSLPVTASPDATIDDGVGLVEVKTTSALWADQPPAYVLDQVQCQLWLTHRSYAHIVVWNGRLRLYTVERDQDHIDELMLAVTRFTAAHLEPRIAPALPFASRDFTLENIRS